MSRTLTWATLLGKVEEGPLKRAYRDATPVEITHPQRPSRTPRPTERGPQKPTSDAARIARFFGAVAYTPKETPSEQ